jgi:hypothetical protein
MMVSKDPPVKAKLKKKGRPRVSEDCRFEVFTVRVPASLELKSRLTKLALLFSLQNKEKLTGSNLAREILTFGVEDYEDNFVNLSLDDIRKRKTRKNEKRAS